MYKDRLGFLSEQYLLRWGKRERGLGKIWFCGENVKNAGEKKHIIDWPFPTFKAALCATRPASHTVTAPRQPPMLLGAHSACQWPEEPEDCAQLGCPRQPHAHSDSSGALAAPVWAALCTARKASNAARR